jgi:Spy/CpxP family protein refolding chaperone
MRVHTIVERGNRLAFAAATAAALIASLAVAPAAFGQQQGQNYPQGQERRGPRDPQQMIDGRVARMTQELQLSADQQARIRTILTNERTQMEALRQKNGFQRPGDGQRPDGARPDSARSGEGRGRGFGGRQIPPEFKALRDQTEKQIDAVLNSTQRAKYEQLKQQREQEFRKHEGERSGQRSS